MRTARFSYLHLIVAALALLVLCPLVFFLLAGVNTTFGWNWNLMPWQNACTYSNPTGSPDLVYLVGGKMINGQGVESISVTTVDYISEGTPLQQYYKDLIPAGFRTTNGIRINPQEEICNDGGCSQWIVYQKNGTWTVIETSRDFNQPVNFSQISWIQLSGNSVYACTDDTGAPGTWFGNCDVHGYHNTFYKTSTLTDMSSDADFAPYMQALTQAMDGKPPFNGKIEVKVIFKK